MPNDSSTPLVVSALIVTRINDSGDTEILNVLAHNKNKYGFPGGKIEAGESPTEAVVRETEEELGVAIKSVQQRWPSSSLIFQRIILTLSYALVCFIRCAVLKTTMQHLYALAAFSSRVAYSQ